MYHAWYYVVDLCSEICLLNNPLLSLSIPNFIENSTIIQRANHSIFIIPVVYQNSDIENKIIRKKCRLASALCYRNPNPSAPSLMASINAD